MPKKLADTQLALKLVDLLIPVDDHGKAAREDGYTAGVGGAHWRTEEEYQPGPLPLLASIRVSR